MRISFRKMVDGTLQLGNDSYEAGWNVENISYPCGCLFGMVNPLFLIGWSVQD